MSIILAGSLQARETAEKIRVACIGNSVTYGYKINNREVNCYPAQLQQLLGDNYEVRNFGFSGATLLRKGHKPYWEKEVFEQAKAFQPDVVVIHLGLNDTDPRNWPNYKDDFRKDYYDLIDTFRFIDDKKEAKVWICRLTPIFHQHPRFKSGTRDWFWQIQEQIEQIAKVKRTGLIDLHTPLYDRPDLFPDALHPNAEGAEILARTIFREVSGDYGGLSLSGVFTDHMVFQREVSIPVYGKGNAGAIVKVQFANRNAEAIVDEHGNWKVGLPAMKAGGPYELKVECEEQSIMIKDILIGEVWLCSGQSNMAFTLKQSKMGESEIPKATNNNIRLFNMKATAWPSAKEWDEEVLEQVNQLQFFSGTWINCKPESAAEFSAIAYYFGDLLQQELNVPVGLILNAVGGSTTEAWIDRKTIEHHPVLVNVLDDWKNNDFVHPWCRERAGQNLAKAMNPLQRHPFQPAYLYETGVAPLKEFPIKGVIWYQGESNAHNVEFHEVLFPQLVKSWRDSWGYEFPFYFVQLSSIDRPTWGHFRDSQRWLQFQIPNSGMVVSSDLGNNKDVHPKHKMPIGERMAKLALAQNYGIDVEYSGPVVESVDYNGNEATVTFSHAEGMQAADGKKIIGFEIAGEDGLFYFAKAKVKGKTILLKSKEIRNQIKHVRYGWQPFTTANLVNKDLLPASTFSTEYQDF
jgi:sialate O-acetylesterase